MKQELYATLKNDILDYMGEEVCSICRYNVDGWTCRAEFNPEDGDCCKCLEFDKACYHLLEAATAIAGE